MKDCCKIIIIIIHQEIRNQDLRPQRHRQTGPTAEPAFRNSGVWELGGPSETNEVFPTQLLCHHLISMLVGCPFQSPNVTMSLPLSVSASVSLTFPSHCYMGITLPSMASAFLCAILIVYLLALATLSYLPSL